MTPQEAYDRWHKVWSEIVRLKKQYHPAPVPLELRGTLEDDVERAAEEMRKAGRIHSII